MGKHTLHEIADSCVLSHFTVAIARIRSNRSTTEVVCGSHSMTSDRSAFWLTETLGRTSQPVFSVLRGAMATEKQPSPSK